MKKYKPIRLPVEAYEKWNNRRLAIQQTVRNETNKQNIKVKMTDVMRFFSQRPNYVYNEELVSYFSKIKRKKGGIL